MRTTFTFQLTPDVRKLMAKRMKAGHFETVSDYVRMTIILEGVADGDRDAWKILFARGWERVRARVVAKFKALGA